MQGAVDRMRLDKYLIYKEEIPVARLHIIYVI